MTDKALASEARAVAPRRRRPIQPGRVLAWAALITVLALSL